MNTLRLKKTIQNHYHLNFEYRTLSLFVELDWKFLCHHINKLSIKHDIEVQALVMMHTHCHMILCSLNKKENFFVQDIKNIFPQTDNSDLLLEPIQNFSQYLNAYKYVYRNPVEAGLVNRCENYPWSSLRILIGKAVADIQVIDKLNLAQNPFKILKWLNQIQEKKLFHFNSLSM